MDLLIWLLILFNRNSIYYSFGDPTHFILSGTSGLISASILDVQKIIVKLIRNNHKERR